MDLVGNRPVIPTNNDVGDIRGCLDCFLLISKRDVFLPSSLLTIRCSHSGCRHSAAFVLFCMTRMEQNKPGQGAIVRG